MSDATNVTATVLKEYVDDLLLISDQVGMTEWEREFLESLRERTTMKFLSPRQKQKVLDLADKYDL